MRVEEDAELKPRSQTSPRLPTSVNNHTRPLPITGGGQYYLTGHTAYSALQRNRHRLGPVSRPILLAVVGFSGEA